MFEPATWVTVMNLISVMFRGSFLVSLKKKNTLKTEMAPDKWDRRL